MAANKKEPAGSIKSESLDNPASLPVAPVLTINNENMAILTKLYVIEPWDCPGGSWTKEPFPPRLFL